MFPVTNWVVFCSAMVLVVHFGSGKKTISMRWLAGQAAVSKAKELWLEASKEIEAMLVGRWWKESIA